VRRWALADVGPGRLMPWLAVAFGFGIILYFTAEQEPAIWAAIALAGIAGIGAVLARHRPIAFPVTLAIAAAAAGFATATVKRAMIAHPVLQAPAWNVEIAGLSRPGRNASVPTASSCAFISWTALASQKNPIACEFPCAGEWPRR